METTIKNEFMQHIATEEAWKSLSGEFAWTETLLEKHGDKVDWEEISENRNIIWTIPMLQKFSKKVDWNTLSDHSNEDWFTESHIETFKDKLDWSKISSTFPLTEEIIDKYIDYLDWSEVIGGGCYYCNFMNDKTFDAIGFYEKYKEYIPMSKLQNSSLWREMVKQRSKQLKAGLLL